MKGYIYTMFKGADPGVGWHMTDPIFRPRPTMGACMPNIRRLVEKGDYVFVVSGHVPHVQQYIVGGFAVDEKINALAAYERFPEYRQRLRVDGTLAGNIIVDADGNRSLVDYHDSFENRIENYIIGRDPLVLESGSEVELARANSLRILSALFQRDNAKTVKDVVGRWRKLNAGQIEGLRNALIELKSRAVDE